MHRKNVLGPSRMLVGFEGVVRPMLYIFAMGKDES